MFIRIQKSCFSKFWSNNFWNNVFGLFLQLLDTVREGVITYASANTRELFYSPATPPPPPPPVEDISSAAEFHASKTQVST